MLAFLYIFVELFAWVGVPVYTFMSGGSESDITRNYILWYTFTAVLPTVIWFIIYFYVKDEAKQKAQEQLEKSEGTSIVQVVLLDKTEQLKEVSEMLYPIGGDTSSPYLHTKQVSDGYLYRFLIVYQNGYKETIAVTDKDERLNDLLVQAKLSQ